MDAAACMTYDTVLPADAKACDTDVALFEAFRQRSDRQALEMLLQRHAEPAWRVARRLCDNDADAEDILQEGFLSCMASAKTFAGRGEVRSWILAVIANAARRVMRTKRRRERRERHDMPALSAPEPSSPDHELAAAANAALEQLPEAYRVVVSMRHLDQLSFADIAQVLGMKEKSVRTRVGRGLDRLRSHLAKRGVAVTTVAVASALSTTAQAAPVGLPMLVQTAVAQGVTQVGTVVVVGAGGLSVMAKVALAIALALSVTGVGYWSVRSGPRLFLGNDDRMIAGQPVQHPALELPITLRLDDTLDVAVHRMLLAIPVAERPVIAIPLQFTSYHSPSVLRDRDAPPRESIRVTCDATNRPLRDVLTVLCASAGLRWRSSRAGIVIDRADDPAVRQEREAAFFDIGDQASAEALAYGTDVDGVRPLLLALADARRSVVASEVLDRVLRRNFPHYPSILQAFSDDPTVCAAVATAIAADVKPRELLIEIAGQLRMPSIVEGCIALAEGGIREPSLVEQLTSNQSRMSMAISAIRALGWVRDPRAVDPLILGLRTQVEAVRVAQCEALAALGDERAIAKLLDLAGDRQARDWHGRRAGLKALGSFDDPRCLTMLGTSMLDRSEDIFTRLVAVEALVGLGGEAARAYLRTQAAFGDSDDDGISVVSRAIEGLSYLNGEGVTDLLITLLPEYFVGSAAAEGLGTINDVSVLPRLADLLATTRGDAYRNVALAIAGIRHPDASALLVATIPTAESGKLWGHCPALARCGTTQARQALMALACDGDVRRRRAAAQYLFDDGEEGTALALDLVEHDDDAEVRRLIMQSFAVYTQDGRLKLPVPVLAAWLTHADAVVRSEAAGLLARCARNFPAEFCRTRIAAALHDSVPAVRMAIIKGMMSHELHRFDHALWLRTVDFLTMDADVGVRVAMAEAAFYAVFTNTEIVAGDLRRLADALEQAACHDVHPRVRATAGGTLLRLIRLGEGNHRLAVDLSPRRAVLEQHLNTESDVRIRAYWRRMLDADEDHLNVRLKWNEDEGEAQRPGTGDF